ncbi:hypothetical protein JQ607_08000 [Bradyrhizobium liaoningense]|uniref:hypothetical protein n=1 Tax=Bradyrhizobium liaoningense TaxID=43992 RepID=UPI001BA43E25|nr:hypothetical protein [Bradyrhizobium liaoningense]MBR0840136.1 hypothetical protein [Bradyrhizobium liaoningense]
MILLRDFALFVLPALVAAGGWLYALSLRGQARTDQERAGAGACRRNDWRADADVLYSRLEHDPEKCEAVFRNDHAQTTT